VDIRTAGARPKKRLIEAACVWARSFLGADVDNRAEIARLEAINGPPEIIRRLQEEQADAAFDVDEAELEIVLLFLRLSRQWRVLPNFGTVPTYLGLDLGVATELLRLRKLDNAADLLDELLVMESAAAQTLNAILGERAKKK